MKKDEGFIVDEITMEKCEFLAGPGYQVLCGLLIYCDKKVEDQQILSKRTKSSFSYKIYDYVQCENK